MPTRLLLLAAAGAAGTLCRYGLAGLVQSGLGTRLPWSTLVVNVAGCLAAGILFGLFESRWAFSGEARVIVLIGFMGAYTTFSTFAFETANFLRDGEWLLAFANFAGQNLLGLALMFAGMALGRLL